MGNGKVSYVPLWGAEGVPDPAVSKYLASKPSRKSYSKLDVVEV